MNTSSEIKFSLDPKWKWLAKDQSGKWFLYTDKPSIQSITWANYEGETAPAQFTLSENPPWENSLHQIINGIIISSTNLKIDDKVMVADDPNDPYIPRYFSHFLDQPQPKIACFELGQTSWSANGTATWNYWRLPTKKELQNTFTP